MIIVNNTPVLFEFVFNSNDSLKKEIANTELINTTLNLNKPRIRQYEKQQK